MHHFLYRRQSTFNSSTPNGVMAVISRYFTEFSIALGAIKPQWDDLRKILPRCQWMANVPNGVETLPKISTG